MVLILDLTAAPDNYNAPVSKAASLMDNYTFYRFSKICELFVNGKDIKVRPEYIMFPNDNAFLTEQYKAYRLQLVQLPDGDISDFRLNKYKDHLLFLTKMEVERKS